VTGSDDTEVLETLTVKVTEPLGSFTWVGAAVLVTVIVGCTSSIATVAESESVASEPPVSSSAAITVTVSVEVSPALPVTERVKVQVIVSPEAIAVVNRLNEASAASLQARSAGVVPGPPTASLNDETVTGSEDPEVFLIVTV